MHTFADLTKALNWSSVYLSGLQSRFELPTFDGAGCSEAYLAFLQSVVHLRMLSITEEMLRDLWHIEKKLLMLLHADTTGSPNSLRQALWTGRSKSVSACENIYTSTPKQKIPA